MRNFPLQRKLILAGLGILLAADIAFAYFTTHLSGSREGRQQALTLQAFRLAQVKDDVKKAAEIRQRTPEFLKKLDDIEGSLLPATKGYSVITQELDQFAKDTHVLKTDVKYREKEVSGRDLTELEIELAVNGDYNGIVHFLNKLQRSKSVYIVDALDVDSQTNGQGPVGVLKVNLHLRTYFRKV